MLLQILRSAHVQDFVRHNRAFGQLGTLLHEITLKDDHVLIQRNQMFFFQTAHRFPKNQAALAANRTTEFDHSVDLCDFRSFFRPARLKQFRNTRQTTGDVLRLGNLARSLGQKSARLHSFVFLHNDVSTRRNRVARNDLLPVIDDHSLRMEILFVLDDDRSHDAGCLVDLTLHGYARNHITELHAPGSLGQNRNVIRIPLDKCIALLYRRTIRDGDNRTYDNVVAFKLSAIFRVYRDRPVLVKNDKVSVNRLHKAQIVKVDVSVILCLDDRLLEQLSGGSTDMERTHRQLSTGFTDALGSDNADGLTELYHPPSRKVTAVTLGANTALRFAGEHRPNLELFYTNVHQRSSLQFLDQLVRFDDYFLGHRVDDGLAAHAPDNTSREIDDFVVSFVDRTDENSVRRSAIRLDNNYVLRGIDQFSSEVARIGRF